MMLAKRPHCQIKRTTSMTEFTLDPNTTTINDEDQPSDQYRNPYLNVVSPRNPRRSSLDMVGTNSCGHFLRACSLCKRRLVPGRDIYMYRGDTAFCSSECRQQQMKQDEKNEKCSFASKKERSSSVAGPEGEPVATAV